MHPCSWYWHLLNVIMKQQAIADVHVMKAMCGANIYWTGHRLVLSSKSLLDTSALTVTEEHSGNASTWTILRSCPLSRFCSCSEEGIV